MKDIFEGLNTVGVNYLLPKITACEQVSKAVGRFSQQEEVKASLEILGTELEKLAKDLNYLRESLNKLTEKIVATSLDLKRAELYTIAAANSRTRDSAVHSIELQETATSSGKFGTATESLESLTGTLKDDVKTIAVDIQYYILSPIDNLRINPIDSLKIDPLISDVKRLAVRVATRQAQANPLALTVSSLAAAAATLVENTEES